MPDLGQLLKSAAPEPPRTLSMDDLASRVRGPRRWVAPLLAAAAVIAIAVPIGVLNLRDEPKRPVAGPPASSTPTIPSPSAASEADRLAVARARWAAAGIKDYTWSFRKTCFCPTGLVTVTVKDDKPGEPVLDPTAVSAGLTAERIEVRTVEDLFDVAEKAMNGNAAKVAVSYDTTGRITWLSVDQLANAIDDEWGYEVASFTVAGAVSPSPAAAACTTAQLAVRVAATSTWYAVIAIDNIGRTPCRIDIPTLVFYGGPDSGAPVATTIRRDVVVNHPKDTASGALGVGDTVTFAIATEYTEGKPSPTQIAAVKLGTPTWTLSTNLFVLNSDQPAPVPVTVSGLQFAPVGTPQPYELYTHCGIDVLDFQGVAYKADRPVVGNPPPGWGNPMQAGTVTKLSADRIVFRAEGGLEASFHRMRPGEKPDVPVPCS